MKKERFINEKTKKAFWPVFSVLLALFTIWAVFKRSDGVSVSDIMEAVKDADKFWLFVAVLFAVLYIFFEAVALCSILKGIGYKNRLKDGLLYSTADVYFSAITPSATGGQPASGFFMARNGIPVGAVTASLLLNIIMYTVSGVVLSAFSVCISPGALDGFNTFSKVIILAGIGGLALLSFFFTLALNKGEKIFAALTRLVNFLHRKKIIHNPEPKLAKLIKARMDYSECAAMIAGRYKIILKALFWNLCQRASQIAVPMFLFLAMGGKSGDALLIFSKQSLITVGANLVPVPGAMGVADYLMVDGFTDIMGREAAFGFEMLSRSITFYISVFVSGIFTLAGYLLIKRRRRSAK